MADHYGHEDEYNVMYDVGEGIVYEEWVLYRHNKRWRAYLKNIEIKYDCECEDTPCNHTKKYHFDAGRDIGHPSPNPIRSDRPGFGLSIPAKRRGLQVESYGSWKVIELFRGKRSLGVAQKYIGKD